MTSRARAPERARRFPLGWRMVATVVAAVLVALVGLALVRTAWISDDAMITFRTVLNVTHGYGLTWNLGERVQAYTHPLWLGVLTLAYSLNGEIYLTTIWLSIAITLLAVVLICLRGRPPDENVVLALTLLLCSKAFIDFGTSGLENPLSHLLLAFLVYLIQRQPERQGRALEEIALVSSLVVLNRLDLVLVAAPLLALAVWQSKLPRRSLLVQLAVGSLPLIGWMVFAVFYYGAPLPNPFYSKLATGLPRGDYLARGLDYYQNLLEQDLPSALTIALGLASVALIRTPLAYAVAAGIGLHLGYIVYIGGDFMAGRFFALPVFLASLLVARLSWRRHPLPGTRAAVVALTIGWLVWSFLTAAPVLSPPTYYVRASLPWGITDERGFYYQRYGLLSPGRSFPSVSSWDAFDQNQRHVHSFYSVGKEGLQGPMLHLVGKFGLVDPLVARLPAIHSEGWRIGHAVRYIPTGYLETLEFGRDKFVDREIAALYRDIALITRGDLLAPGRLQAIVRQNLGLGRPTIDRSRYRAEASRIPERLVPDLGITYEEVSATPKPDYLRWDYPGVWVIGEQREIVFETAHKARTHVELSLDHNDLYLLRFHNGKRAVGEIRVGPATGWGLSTYRARLPPKARRRGIDRIVLRPLEGDGSYSLGHLVLTGRTRR